MLLQKYFVCLLLKKLLKPIKNLCPANEIISKLQSFFKHVTDSTFDSIDVDNLVLDDSPELTGKEMIVQLKKKF